MHFEWDEVKNAVNRQKHGISFEEVVPLFAAPHALGYDSDHSQDEDRYWALGPAKPR